jgi:(1->4)-alpha-D-glucan 1-alpha-D-glucosylmutase
MPMTIPRATYRLQLHRGFAFADAIAALPYLAALGVSHVYASPCFAARPGSTHGYDVVDPNAINPELGGSPGFAAFCAALRAHGLRLMLDIVPNHMAVLEADNAWWRDVLEHGRASRYAEFFDIDWEPASAELHDKVLLPVLEEPYGTVLERGELAVAFDATAGGFELRYRAQRFPLDPREYTRVLDLAQCAADDAAAAAELAPVLAAFATLPAPRGGETEVRLARAARASVLKQALAALCARAPAVNALVARRVAAINGSVEDPSSFDALHVLIKVQPWRLAYWRMAGDDINYRRFFDVNALAGLRMEREEVFDAVHALTLRLVASGDVDALRIDHPDGLADPAAYFARLQRAVRPPADAIAQGGLADVAQAQRLPLYVVVEKILAHDEALPRAWPVHGTTGYDFAALVNALFVDATAARKFDRLYRGFTGMARGFAEVARDAKRAVMQRAFGSDVNALATRLTDLAKADRHTCDFTFNGLRQAIVGVAAHFPVYRTYVAAGEISADDRRAIETATAAAIRDGIADRDACEFVAATLMTPARGDDACAAMARRFTARFQQFTAPVMAKGVEDTACYVYDRLASLNDVGTDPRVFGVSVRSFHAANAERARHWPHALLATSTHDSKRAEDVRARLDVLSEVPALWRLAIRRWHRMNRQHKRMIDGIEVPSANDEYLLYQTLLGAWPAAPLDAAAQRAFAGRIRAYMQKAVREAKMHTSWLEPDLAYESALEAFIDALLAPATDNTFIDDFLRLQQPIARTGFCNSLAQTVLKLVSPGVPDIYQGAEWWDLSLVDPDNRRPVDFASRAAALDDLAATCPGGMPDATRVAALFVDPADGRAKQYVIWRALQLRARAPALFAAGRYEPLRIAGARAANACACARTLADDAVVAVVPRLAHRLAAEAGALALGERAWGDTELALPGNDDAPWRDEFAGVEVAAAATPAGRKARLADIFAHAPVALLRRASRASVTPTA